MTKQNAILLGVGVVAFIGVRYLLKKRDEKQSNASGVGCGASGAPSTYLEGTAGCDFLHNCENNGGVGSATAQSGGGYLLDCSNGGNMTTGGDGGTRFGKLRTRSFSSACGCGA